MIIGEVILLAIIFIVSYAAGKQYRRHEKKLEYFEKTMQNLNRIDVPQLYREFKCVDEYIKVNGNMPSWEQIKAKRLNRAAFVGEEVKQAEKEQVNI